MDTNEAFELLKPEIERLINESPKEVKTAYIPTESGEYINAAFRVINLAPISDALSAFAEQHGLEVTLDLEKRAKEYMRAYRLEHGVISEEYEWAWLNRWEVHAGARRGNSYTVVRFQAPTLWDLAPNADKEKGNWKPVFKGRDIVFEDTDEILHF